MVKTTNLAVLALLVTAPLRGASAVGSGDHGNLRGMREAREEAIQRVGGEVARDLVESHGEVAVAALKRCSPEGGRRFCEWANTGALDKLGRADDLLLAVAQLDAGDDVALWLVRNGESRLSDRDALDAFCESPTTIALGLQPLDKLAAARRARRLEAENYAARITVRPTEAQRPPQQVGDWQLPVNLEFLRGLAPNAIRAGVVVAILAVVAGLTRLMRRGRENGPPM